MTPSNKICLTVLMMITFISCSEIYVPDVDSDTEALVVEGLITDGDGPFTVQLTEALSYNSDSTAETTYVSDAELTVNDSEGQTYELTYRDSGKYALPSTFKATVGNSYTLHIETSDGEIYESDAQTLLPPESFDSLYTTVTTEDYVDDDDVLTTVEGYDVRVNLFKSVSSTNPMPLCRFESNVVVQYEYDYTELDPETGLEYDWYWDIFGWRTFQMGDDENITEERSKTANPEIKDHYLCFIPKGTSSYGFKTSQSASIIYYYRFKQYTINEDTYNFYEEANSQLAASGKLFDPITSQLYGNMECTSDPSKIVLGLFEVSSVTQAAFVISKSPRQVTYLDVPAKGYYEYKVSTSIGEEIVDPDYDVIPYPSWWYHND